MSALWQIAEQYRADAARLMEMDLDEQTLADTLESIGGDLEAKAQSVAFVARSLEADAAAAKAWAKQATERAKAAEARAARLRKYLSDQLTACGITKVQGPGITLLFRKSSVVIVDDEAQVPDQYRVQKPAEVSKTLISEAISAGVVVPGARIEERSTLQIK